MYSDDEEVGFGGAVGRRSPSPGRGRRDGDGRDARRRSRSRGAGRDFGGRRDGDGGRGGPGRGGGGKGGGKGGGRARTTGRELPKLNSIHRASVASIQSYGAFVRLGDGSTYKDGLLHVSRISASGRIEAVSDVLSEGDGIWVKVSEVNDDAQKYSVDMRFVRQKDGEDLDPNNTHADSGRGPKGGGMHPEPIRIGAVQSVTCSRCGARGHMARECWAAGGSNYALVEEAADDARPGVERPAEAVPGADPELVRAALKAYMERQAVGSGGGKKDKKEKKKEEKKEKKRLKKEKKKEKKDKKKRKKEEKKSKEKAKEKKKKEKHKEEKDTTVKGGRAVATGSAALEEGSVAALLAGLSSASSSESSSSSS